MKLKLYCVVQTACRFKSQTLTLCLYPHLWFISRWWKNRCTKPQVGNQHQWHLRTWMSTSRPGNGHTICVAASTTLPSVSLRTSRHAWHLAKPIRDCMAVIASCMACSLTSPLSIVYWKHNIVGSSGVGVESRDHQLGIAVPYSGVCSVPWSKKNKKPWHWRENKQPLEGRIYQGGTAIVVTLGNTPIMYPVGQGTNPPVYPPGPGTAQASASMYPPPAYPNAPPIYPPAYTPAAPVEVKDMDRMWDSLD